VNTGRQYLFLYFKILLTNRQRDGRQ